MTPPALNSEPGTPNSKPLLTPARFALLLFALVFAAWPDVWLGSGTFVFRDFSLFHLPFAHYHRESFWRGELPLWNPLNNCGVPFLAQWNPMVLYPGTLIYLLLPLPCSLGIFCLLHLYLGGLGAYAVARRWTGHELGAAVAGVAYAGHGLMQQSLMWPCTVAALGLLPWVVLTVESGVREGGRKLVVAALVGALQMLTGAPEVILLTWLMLAGLAAEKVFSVQCSVFSGRPEPTVTSKDTTAKTEPWLLNTEHFRFLALIALVALLAAAQLLPFLQLLSHSQRDAGFNGAVWSLPIWGTANLVVPLFRTVLSAPGVPFQDSQSWTASFYAGLPVLALALAAVRRGSPARVWLLAAVGLFSLGMALGENGWLYPAVKQIVPLGGMRYPAKFVLPLTFALPLLAAFAVRALLPALGQPGPPDATLRRRLLITTGLLLVSSAGLTLYGCTHPLPDEGAAGQQLLLRGSLIGGVTLLLSVVTVLRLARAGTPERTLGLSLALLAVIFVDLKTHLPQLTPRVGPEVFQPGHPLVQAPDAPRLGGPRAAHTWHAVQEFKSKLLPSLADTLLLQRLSLYDNLNLLDGLAKTDGFFSLFLRTQLEVEARLFLAGGTNSVPAPLADFLGVAYVTSPTNVFQWHHRPTALPLITAGQRPEFAAAEISLPAMASPNWNPRATVFLHPWDKALVPHAGDLESPSGENERTERRLETAGTGARILSANWTTHRIECEVESPAPTLVVLAQAFYAPWQATVNGQPANLLRANHAFQAVPVPAGRSRVRLDYVDRRFHLGVLLSALGLVLCGVLWCRDKPRAALITNH